MVTTLTVVGYGDNMPDHLNQPLDTLTLYVQIMVGGICFSLFTGAT